MKILLIRLSSIGDIVLTSPVVRCLYRQIPDVEIHFLTKTAFSPLLESNPYIRRVWLYEIADLVAQLRLQRFDYIIDLHKNLRTFRLRWALGGVPAFSFPKLNWQKWLLVRLHLNRMPRLHLVDRYLQSLQPLGVHNDGQGLDYFIPPPDQITAPQLHPSLQTGNYWVLVVGAAHATKAIPESQMATICRLLSPIAPVALVGGKAESAAGARLATHDRIINLCGQLSLHRSASVIQQSRAVISPDTGMMHIAAALRKPILSVWGSTVPDFGMYPYYPDGNTAPHTIAQLTGLRCRPCSKIGFARCPKGHFRCMNDLEIEPILKSFLSLCP